MLLFVFQDGFYLFLVFLKNVQLNARHQVISKWVKAGKILAGKEARDAVGVKLGFDKVGLNNSVIGVVNNNPIMRLHHTPNIPKPLCCGFDSRIVLKTF